jgi:hypothetical protein
MAGQAGGGRRSPEPAADDGAGRIDGKQGKWIKIGGRNNAASRQRADEMEILPVKRFFWRIPA